MRSALTADRRLRVAGFAAAELLIARLTLLVLVDAALAAFLVLITSLFAPPQQLIPFYIAIFFAAVLYSFYGALFALFIRNEMGGILAITFLANIDVGYLQLPGYSTVLEEWWIKLLPGYFPVQLAIDAAFTDTAELFLTSLWAIPHGLMIAGFMLGAYQQATEIRPFMPEESGRRFGKLLLFGIGAGLLTAAGVFRLSLRQRSTASGSDGRQSGCAFRASHSLGKRTHPGASRPRGTAGSGRSHRGVARGRDFAANLTCPCSNNRAGHQPACTAR